MRIWTDSHTSESLKDLLDHYTYGEIMLANDWLDILDQAERKAQKQAEREAKRKR